MRCAKVAGLMVASAVATLVLFASPAQADSLSDEQQFVVGVNQIRAKIGLGPLTVDANLTDIARAWAQKMADAGAISHNGSLGSQVTSDWKKVGENVGVGPTVQELINAFVKSPHHYANLSDPSFTRIGVGVVYRGKAMYTAHEFMQLRGAAAVAAPKPSAPKPKPVTPTPTTARATTPATAPKPSTSIPVPTPVTPLAPDWLRYLFEALQRFDPKYLPNRSQ